MTFREEAIGNRFWESEVVNGPVAVMGLASFGLGFVIGKADGHDDALGIIHPDVSQCASDDFGAGQLT